MAKQTVEFRLRNVPGTIWEDFKILCIRENTFPNAKIKELLKAAVVESTPTG